MTTKTLTAQAINAPTAFKALASLTFAIGVVIHTLRVIIGVENIVRYVMTPPADVAFGVVILAATIPGILSWRRYSGGLGQRVLYGFMMFILIISVPLHLATIMTWSTEYLTNFPVWYSVAEIPMFTALAYFAQKLKFDGE
jgi:hypothetical protein